MVRGALVLVLIAVGCYLAAADDYSDWQTGRATHYGGAGDPWSIHSGSCGYQYLDPTVGTGWDVAAISDVAPDYSGSCGRCYEIACNPADISDNYGQHFDRKSICHDSGQSLVVMVTDTCPCNYPANYYSNKRWCCGDTYHFDMSVWAFERLADTKWGVISIKFRRVPCWHCPDKPAVLPCDDSPTKNDHSAPSGWQSSWDKRPYADRHNCPAHDPFSQGCGSSSSSSWSTAWGSSSSSSSSAWSSASSSSSSSSAWSSASPSSSSSSSSASSSSSSWWTVASGLFNAGSWLGMSNSWNPWSSQGPWGGTAQCGTAYDHGSVTFKTDPGSVSGKKHISFQVQLSNGKIPDFMIGLASSSKGSCQSVNIPALHASKWDGDWATFDIPLGAFAWKQNWDDQASFDGCGGSVSAWDIDQIDFKSNQSYDQQLCISNIKFY